MKSDNFVFCDGLSSTAADVGVTNILESGIIYNGYFLALVGNT